MKKLVFITWLMIGMTGSSLVHADEEQDYYQCLLEHQPKVQLDQVVIRVRQACDKVHRDNLMLPRKKAYFKCVLDYLPPVETESAVQDVLGACANRHDFKRSSAGL
ncbi:MAG: hypothetical protein KKB45_18210 [Gammaproteobacteria bacterium]|nr:hypothetical protein [Gammaproteobacteria bacterium]